MSCTLHITLNQENSCVKDNNWREVYIFTKGRFIFLKQHLPFLVHILTFDIKVSQTCFSTLHVSLSFSGRHSK